MLMPSRPPIEMTFCHRTGEIGLRPAGAGLAKLTPRQALELAARLDDAAHQSMKVAAMRPLQG